MGHRAGCTCICVIRIFGLEWVLRQLEISSKRQHFSLRFLRWKTSTGTSNLPYERNENGLKTEIEQT